MQLQASGDREPSIPTKQVPPTIELQRGRLQLHSELIDALRLFSSQSRSGNSTVKSREEVLEQALVEQNQILDIMQELITSLDSENKFSKEKIVSQAKTIQEISEAKDKQQPREVAGTGFEKTLAEKNQLIASLQSRLESLPAGARKRNQLPSAALLTSTRTKLEAERVRVIELEEELSSRREEVNKLKSELSGKRSVLISKDSEILHLRHEMEVLKKFHWQQQDVMMSLRTSLMDKDIQLTSLTRALGKEKNLSETMRNRQLSPYSSTSKVNIRPPHLFEQVQGRDIHAVELERETASTELGFSYSRVELPVSSRLPCLVVKAVREGSVSRRVLQPGDELLEINGYSCRSTDQEKAIVSLEKAVGTIRLVVARDSDINIIHSTPVKSNGSSLVSPGNSTLWATALADPGASFTTASALTPFSTPNSPKMFQLPVTPGGTSATSPITPRFTLDDYKTPTLSQLQADIAVAELKERLSESEVARIELENDLDSAGSAFEDLKMEYELTKAENFELQQQHSTNATEMVEIQSRVAELQQLLANLQEQVATEQTQIATLEAQNHSLQDQLRETQEAYELARKTSSGAQVELQKVTSETSKQIRELKEEMGTFQSQNEQLKSTISHQESDLEDLKNQLHSRKTDYEQTIASLEQEKRRLKVELQSLQEASVNSATSTHDELEQVHSQLNSAKSLLMQAEMNESSMKIELRRLKQAADLGNQQLVEVEREYKKVREEVGTYKQLAERKTLEMETLTLGLKAAQSKLKANKEMASRLQNEVDNQRRNSAKLSTQINRAEQGRSKAESKMRSLELERLLQNEQLQSSSEERDQLFQQLEESIAESTSLQQEVDGLQTKLKELQGDVNIARQRESQLEKHVTELTAAKRNIEESSVKQLEVLKAEKGVLEQEVSRAQSDATTIKESSYSSVEEMTRLRRELQQQREALVTSEGTRVTLQQECDMLRKNEIKSSREAESLKSENEALTQTATVLRTIQEESQRELDTQKKRVLELTADCSNLQSKRNELEMSRDALSKDLHESRVEVELLARSKQEHEDQFLETQLQLGQLSRELEEKIQEFRESSANCEQLREEVELERGRNEQLRANAGKLQAQNESLLIAKKQSDDMVSSMEFVHQQDQAKLEQFTEALRSREDEVKKTTDELSALQLEVRGQLQHVRSENAGLRESIETLKKHLAENEEGRETDVSDLKQKLKARDRELGSVQEDLQAQRSANSINQATITQLQTSLQQATEERDVSHQKMEESSKQMKRLNGELSQMKDQLVKVRQDKNTVENSNVVLSMESVTLKQQLRQSKGIVDELRAKVQALEMNLEVANRSLGESEQLETELSQTSVQLEHQLGEATLKVEKLQNEMAKTSLELHSREELVSQLKANLELRQAECEQLQQSLITAETTMTTQRERIQSLEVEISDLQRTADHAREVQEGMRRSMLNMEAERASNAEKHRQEISSLSQDVENLRGKEKDHLEQIGRLELALKEAESTREQLLAAQDALKSLIASQGDQKEQEVLKLSNKVTELETSIVGSRQELSQARIKETEAQTRLQELREMHDSVSKRCEDLVSENDSLQREIELHQATDEQLSELHMKVVDLDENLRAKTEKLTALNRNFESLDLEYKVTKAENEGLLGKVSELASVKVSLVEKATELERVRGELANEMKSTQAMTAERDQLLAMLRKLEVEKHTEAVQQATPKVSSGASREQILAQLQYKEEEAFRLREYVGKLLTNVVEKAPFVLENMH